MRIQDSAADQPVSASSALHSTQLFDLVQETFRLNSSGEELTRAYIRHPGAVAVLAVDEQERVLLIRQYRHPVRMYLWEVPAGLLDIEGEPLLETAKRELQEEADLRAETWHTLTDFYTTPGANNEAIRIYLAEGISAVPEAERHIREAEESEIEFSWIPLTDAVEAVLDGRIHNPSAVTGILALHAVRTGAGAPREARAPWPDHPRGIAP